MYIKPPNMESVMSEKRILAWKCSIDGKYYAYFDRKKCRYCIPVYDKEELKDKEVRKT